MRMKMVSQSFEKACAFHISKTCEQDPYKKIEEHEWRQVAHK